MTTNLYLLMHAQQPRTEKTAEINRSTFGINLCPNTKDTNKVLVFKYHDKVGSNLKNVVAVPIYYRYGECFP